MIKVEIFDNGQIIAHNNIIADSVLFEKISFNFPESWNGYKKPPYSERGCGHILGPFKQLIQDYVCTLPGSYIPEIV